MMIIFWWNRIPISRLNERKWIQKCVRKRLLEWTVLKKLNPKLANIKWYAFLFKDAKYDFQKKILCNLPPPYNSNLKVIFILIIRMSCYECLIKENCRKDIVILHKKIITNYNHLSKLLFLSHSSECRIKKKIRLIKKDKKNPSWMLSWKNFLPLIVPDCS